MTGKRIALVISLALLHGGLTRALAEMPVAQYLDLAVARLELARTTWLEEERSPSAEEESALWEEHGTSEKAFHAFAAKRREEIAAHLEEYPELAERIQSLSDEIAELVEQSEVEQ